MNKENDRRDNAETTQNRKEYKVEAARYRQYWQNTLKDNEALKKEKERLVSEKESLLSEKAHLLDKISSLETQLSQIKANTGVLQESADNALQQQYEQMLNMVCYSMVRGYPSIEMRSKKKQGHRNKGTRICRCGVKCIPNQNKYKLTPILIAFLHLL